MPFDKGKRLATQGVLFLACLAFMLWWTGVLKGDERQLRLLPVRLFNRLRGQSATPLGCRGEGG